MKKIFLIQSTLFVLTLLLNFVFPKLTHEVNSCAVGALFMLINLLIFSLVGRWILDKKFVAISWLIIVLKYALLSLTIYELLKLPWLQPGWFFLGLSSLVLSVVLSLFRF